MKKWIISLLLFSSVAFASADRTLDGQFITNGSATLTLPTSTDTIVGRATTDTLTNKTISGASNTLTNISAASITSGTLGVANGGTGTTTFTTNGMLYGNGTSAIGATSAGSQFQVFQAGSGGVPTVGAVALNQSAAVTGTLAVSNGGTGASTLTANNVILGNGTSAVQFVAPGTSGNVLTSNGTTWTSAAISTAAPSLNGTSASPQSVTAGGGISLSSISYNNIVWVVGNGGAVTVTATPSITAGTANGQRLLVIGTSNTNTVRLDDEATTAGSTLQLNGAWVGGLYSVLELMWDHTGGFWVEVARR